MMATAINGLTILLVTLGFLVTLVSAETYYIIPTDDSTTCPPSETTPTGNMSFPVTPTDHTPLDENATCLTLTQFVQHWSEPISLATNITQLIFVLGNHTLDSRLQIQTVENLVLRVATQTNSSPTSVAIVTCTNSTGFRFENVNMVSVNGLVFRNCCENTVRSVDELRMENCRFENGHGMELRNIGNATFERSSFISLTAFGTDDRYSDPNHKLGGAIFTFDSGLLFRECLFEFNSGGDGGAIWADCCSVRIHASSFYGNRVDKKIYGRAIVADSGSITISSSSFNTAVFGSGGAIHIAFDASISIQGSNFSRNTATDGGAIGMFVGNNISIHDSNFWNNTASFGGVIQTFGYNNTISIYGSSFIRNSAAVYGGAIRTLRCTHKINNSIFNHNLANQGGAIYVESGNLTFNGFLQITNNSATTGVVFALQSTLLISGDTIVSDNKASFYAFNSNVTFSGLTNFTNNSHNIYDTSIAEGGAITAFQSDIVFIGTVNIMYNAKSNYYGGAIVSSDSKIYTYGDTTIAQNTAPSGGGIYAYQSELYFEGRTSIEENVGEVNGGGIYAVGSTIKLTGGQLEFIGNRAENGGGIYLELNTKLYVIKSVAECFCNSSRLVCLNGSYRQLDESSLRLNFTDNSAKYGGALYVSDNTNSGTCSANTESFLTSSECFFQDLALYTILNNQGLIIQDTFFDGNSANISGGTLFGGLLDRCTVSPYAQVFNKFPPETTLDAISYLTNITNLKANDTQSEISSKPVRVCLCKNNQPDCENSPPTLKVKKGETFNISLVAVDQVRNPIPSYVRAFLSSNLGGLAEGQDTQTTTSNCTELNFTITSPRDHSEQLVLYAKGPCRNLGISQTRVNVTFLPCDCPIGFIRTTQQSTCNCECDPCLSPTYITDCYPANSSVRRRDNFQWISYINKTVDDVEDYQNECQYLIHPYCPFDYCHPSSTPVWINLNTPTGSDAQCAFNRTGKLCGSCEDGLSLSLGSSRCMPCSNYWLALLIVFAVAGVALVAFLLVFNLTVAVGTINGLIFYANILTTSRSTFFPFQSPNFFTMFIAWLNLDFGFVTCFFDGMDGYAKEWLQLAFPIYIIFLVIVVIIACEYSTRIARFFTHTNPVATLATLILLSFAKSSRVIVAGLSRTTLEYPDGSRESVWLIDANIRCFEGKHIPLFLVALLILLVGIVYTSLLFSYQWLQRCPIGTKWIKNARFYPFMDAYLAPYNLKHRYWTGLLLFIRAFLYFLAGFNISREDPGNNLLSIICTLVCLLVLKASLPVRIYKSWSLDALENSFILNLILFSVGSLYIRATGVGNQEALAYTSTSIAFITFLAILIYHTYAFILPKKTQNKLTSVRRSRLFSTNSNKEESNDPEIIAIPNMVTYTEIDGIPTVNISERDNHMHDASFFLF